MNNYEGINSGGYTVIQNNLIAGNYYGVLIGGGTIQGNIITDNSIGISPSTSALITNNNILGNIQYNIALSTNINVDATHNWWGTTSTQAINQTIYDSKSSPTLGTVSFLPFLTASYPFAPTIQNIALGPIPIPVVHYFYPSPIVTSPPISTIDPIIPPSPNPTPTPSPSSTRQPTPNSLLLETLAQLDITAIARIVLLILAIIWVTVIVFYVDRQFTHKKQEKP